MIDNIQTIHEELYKPLLRFVVGFCRDIDLAENVVGDVFAILLEKQEPPPDLRGWLFLTAKYEVISHYRQIDHFESIVYARNKSNSSDLRPVENDALEHIVHEEQIQKVLPLLERLTPRQRVALHLRLFEDYSSREAGQAMNLTETQVRTVYGGALEKIRKPLKVSVKVVRGTCSYGVCKKEIVSRDGFCEKHLRVKRAKYVRRNQHKKHGWS